MFLKSFIKKTLYYSKYKKVGDNSFIDNSCRGFLKNVSVGNNCNISEGCYFNSYLANVDIGNYVVIAPEVMFITGNHKIDTIGNYILENKKEADDKEYDKDIIIEDDVWIGARVIILKGVTIHEGAVVGAGAVVTKDVPPYSVVGGNPASIIKQRFTQDELEKHKKQIKERHGR